MVERSYWPEWARFLQRWGIVGLATVFLETAGPFNILFAQMLYFGQPLFGRPGHGQWEALAEMFEHRDELRSFTSFLRQEAL
jgi:hypothetical protein